MKSDVSEFIQNEIKQKLNLHSKEEYQTLVDKRIIIAREFINKYLNSNTQKNNNDNMEELW